jgi:Spy/CpxP family protein refolding chaperone
MDYFFKKRFSFWLVILLLLINIAAISTIIYHIISDKSTTQTIEIKPDAGNIITGELGLSPDQKSNFKNINGNYNQQSQKILDQLTEKRSEMLAELAKDNPDTNLLHTIASEIGHLHTNLKLLTIENFLELKKLCTPEQQIQLSKMFSDMLECEGHFKGMGKQYRYRQSHGQGGGKGWQKSN